MYKKRYKRKESKEDIIFELISTLSFVGIAYLGFTYYLNRQQFWFEMNHYVFPVLGITILLICAYVFYVLQNKKRKERYFERLIQQIEGTDLERMIVSFIDQFGKEGELKSWEYRGYKFEWKRLDDFRESVNQKNINISTKDYGELSEILKYFIDKKENRYLSESIETKAVHSMVELSRSGVEFENLIVRLYNSMGYASKRVGGSGDQGADVIANKNGESLLIQAKCYREPVSNKAVQEAVAGRMHHGCTRAVVVTTSYFTSGAIALAKSNSVELIDGELLKRMLIEHLQEAWQ
ncbi:restriction endonuclease [Patescibacteria group bacterium]|nr:MAG: restriction endonuclease [Patescibacteria group bacterium]